MAGSDPAQLDDVRETPLRAADYGKHAGDDSIAPWRMEPEGTGHDRSEPIGHEPANHRARPMQSRFDHFLTQPQPSPVSDVLSPSTSRSMKTRRYASGRLSTAASTMR